MVRWVKAPGRPAGQSVLRGHAWAFLAASILFVLLSASFGAAGEQVEWNPSQVSPIKLPPTLRSGNDAGTPNDHDPALSGRALGQSPARHQPAVIYPFKLAEKHYLTPSFSLNYDDAGGEPGQNRTADIRLAYSYHGDPLVLVVNAVIDRAGYDKEESAFGKTTNDDGYGVSASIYYTNPWDWSLFRGNAFRLFATGTYYYTDSKGDAFRQEAASGAAGISLEW